MRGGDFYGRVVDRFIQQAIGDKPITVYGDGMQTRSFTYVSDSIEAIMLLLKGGITGEVYNIGSDRETTILDLAKIVKETTKSNSEIKFSSLPPYEPTRRSADITKLKLLGFIGKVPLNEGIQLMVRKYKAP
jgi:nucleoside-diphosphate-sugar epimerase